MNGKQNTCTHTHTFHFFLYFCIFSSFFHNKHTHTHTHTHIPVKVGEDKLPSRAIVQIVHNVLQAVGALLHVHPVIAMKGKEVGVNEGQFGQKEKADEQMHKNYLLAVPDALNAVVFRIQHRCGNSR